MQPDQNQYSIDYLNQIAPQAPKKGLAPTHKWLFIGLGAALLIAIILITIGALGKSNSPTERLAARLKGTETIVDESQKSLKSSQLRSLNSSLELFLANTNRDIAEPLKNNGLDVAKLNPAILAQEDGSKLKERLEDARLNAVFDRTYAREMAYQLETTLALMRQVYTTTNSKSLKEFLETSYNNLEPVQKQFADFVAE